jgi:hypothetical protein
VPVISLLPAIGSLLVANNFPVVFLFGVRCVRWLLLINHLKTNDFYADTWKEDRSGTGRKGTLTGKNREDQGG